MVELAISLMAFLFLVFGVMDFGWGIYDANWCTSAAQDAVRYASVRGSQSTSPATADDVANYVKGLVVAMDTSRLSVNTTWTPDNNPGSTVQVVVSYTVNPISGLSFSSFPVSSTATTVINH
jgi:Flp pilus assembly protein TadG